jgi:Zn-dependent peptidase ImmA (M78 family)
MSELPDLRTVESQSLGKFSQDLMEIINDARLKQDWYKNYMIREEMPINKYVGSLDRSSSVINLASSLRNLLNLSDDQRADLKALVNKIESIGILVMRSSIVKLSTKRSLQISEFRGFALSDKYAPVIFINSNDSKEPQTFTLIHELVHIGIEASGISNLGTTFSNSDEKLCNAVAGEFLVPSSSFIECWDKSDNEMDSKIKELAHLYKVSKWVITRRALDFRKINKNDYEKIISTYREKYEKEKNLLRKKSGSPKPYTMAKERNSNLFMKTILPDVISGRTLYRDANLLTGYKPETLKKFYNEEFKRA